MALKEKIARYVFHRANIQPEYLDMDKLLELQKKYHRSVEKVYKYDDQSLQRRGEERASEVLALKYPDSTKQNDFLELGCGDGMASVALKKGGKHAVGVDHVSDRFDARAVKQGVDLLAMDASSLDFPDSSFDVVFSYNAFEHFSDPESVLGEIVRVLRPGGVAYLNFGPLYHSVWGLHAYDYVFVPYCQHLFSEQQLNEYCDNNGYPGISYDYVNKWSVEQYRNLWKEYAGCLDVAFCHELRDSNGMDLIIRYPYCFRKNTDYFDDLMISSIEIMLHKPQEINNVES